MNILVIVLTVLVAVLGIGVALLFKKLNEVREAVASHMAEINSLRMELDVLEKDAAKPWEITVNDIPCAYDAKTSTLTIEGNLVATGFIACGSKSTEQNA